MLSIDRRFRVGFVWLTVLMMSVGVAAADRIYQWVDSAGIRHFTNNELNIPTQYRVKIKDMKLQPAKPSEEQSPMIASGEKLWGERCASCHSPGIESKEGLQALGAVVVLDPVTRFARAPDVLSSVLRGAVEGRTTDMKRLEISDADLLEISHYLIEYSNNY